MDWGQFLHLWHFGGVGGDEMKRLREELVAAEFLSGELQPEQTVPNPCSSGHGDYSHRQIINSAHTPSFRL